MVLFMSDVFFEFILGSFGALCKISNSKIFDKAAAALTGFIQFQPNFMINMLATGEYRVLRLLAICPEIKSFMAL